MFARLAEALHVQVMTKIPSEYKMFAPALATFRMTPLNVLYVYALVTLPLDQSDVRTL